VAPPKLDDSWVQGAAQSIVAAVGSLPGTNPAARLLADLVTRTDWQAALDGASYRRHEGCGPT
jgi:hypothetical protein